MTWLHKANQSQYTKTILTTILQKRYSISCLPDINDKKFHFSENLTRLNPKTMMV